MKNEFSLNNREKQLILGTLLGDASIVKSSEKSARIEVKQSGNQTSFTHWKYKELERLVGTPPKVVPNKGFGKTICRFSTLSSGSLLDIYRLVRPNNKKEVNPDWLNAINDPIALAVWYMDDGSMSKIGGMAIHTEGFPENEVNLLVEWLQSVWKVECHSYYYRTYWRIMFPAVGRDKFQDLIREYVIPEMQYKLTTKLEKVYCSMCGVLCEVDRHQFCSKVLLCDKEECSKKWRNLYQKVWIWRKTHE